MAQQRTVVHTDDLDGKPLGAGDHHRELFAVNGYVYEIDLSTKHRSTFLAALEKYASHGHVVGRLNKLGQVTTPRGKRTHLTRESLLEIRNWARANGYPDLAERGRIPAEVQQAYDLAHGGSTRNGSTPTG